MMYYFKYHCKLNHIEYFWCNIKQWARKNCHYTLDNLRRCVPQVLASVFTKIILAHYYHYRRKIDLYQKVIIYDSSTWKTYTTHHKPTNKNEDQ